MAVRLAVGIFAALALAAAMLGLGALLDETETGRSVAPQSRATIGAPFHLVDQNGHPFSSDALKGRVTLLFFGFTHCPDICPTTLAIMSTVMDRLGDRAGEVTPVFISVDPTRDTPAAMKAYADMFDPRIVMLTGSQGEIDAVVKSYMAYAKRVDLENGDYTMDHTASVYLIGRDGAFRSTFDLHESEDVAVDKVRLALDAP